MTGYQVSKIQRRNDNVVDDGLAGKEGLVMGPPPYSIQILEKRGRNIHSSLVKVATRGKKVGLKRVWLEMVLCA